MLISSFAAPSGRVRRANPANGQQHTKSLLLTAHINTHTHTCTADSFQIPSDPTRPGLGKCFPQIKSTYSTQTMASEALTLMECNWGWAHHHLPPLPSSSCNNPCWSWISLEHAPQKKKKTLSAETEENKHFTILSRSPPSLKRHPKGVLSREG